MSYHFTYPNEVMPVHSTVTSNSSIESPTYSSGRVTNTYANYRQRSYSSDTFSSDEKSSSNEEESTEMLKQQGRYSFTVVRAPTPPPIIKRVFHRALTPERPVMERIVIRPQAQEIIEQIIEQPRTRVLPMHHPFYSNSNLPYHPVYPFNNGTIHFGKAQYHSQSMFAPVRQLSTFHGVSELDSSFSSTSSFECVPSASSVMPSLSTFQPMISQPVQRSPYIPHHFIYPTPQAMPFIYHPMFSNGFTMIPTNPRLRVRMNNFGNPFSLVPSMTQQLVF